MKKKPVSVYLGEEIAAYGFGGGHPFSCERHDAFCRGLETITGYNELDLAKPVRCSREELELFHTPDYIDRVIKSSETGQGFLDRGDTPAFVGVYETTSYVVGSALDASRRIMSGEIDRAFVPIAGLHHASRAGASGFCVFNDCGVVIENLRKEFGLNEILYVDIDAHHGDGVYYGFEDDPDLIFADIHESGIYLFPGTGTFNEVGKGAALGRKLNIEMKPGSGDDAFMEAWQKIEMFLTDYQPQFILLQCGADSLGGDPLTHLAFSERAHEYAALRLKDIAMTHCGGKMLAVGGGGYNMKNIAKAWPAVVSAMM